EWFDMAFVGGGNSIKTVSHDYECVKKTPIIMFDHYFRPDDDKCTIHSLIITYATDERLLS
ncbi:MAG: hypothetical protein VX027_01540, partial [Bacteroidota bacterium]|nr:hypothetical protein [Bacteroidota bacterium]